MKPLLVVVTLALAYMLGSIPSGLIIGKYCWGIDPRTRGSGNIGFTNVWRTVGVLPAVLVLLTDVGKGAAAVLVANTMFPLAPSAIRMSAQPQLLDSAVVALAAFAALMGNNFSVFLKFRGGKGIGIASGILLAMTPQIAGILLAVWLATVAATRYVSLGSLIIAVLFPPLMYYFQGENPAYLVFAVTASALVIMRHRGNIGRLIAGSELKVSRTQPGSDV